MAELDKFIELVFGQWPMLLAIPGEVPFKFARSSRHSFKIPPVQRAKLASNETTATQSDCSNRDGARTNRQPTCENTPSNYHLHYFQSSIPL